MGRLKTSNLIKSIDKEGREYVYDYKKTKDKIPNELEDYKEALKFLNDFFKENIDYLMKSKEIVNFVLKNEKNFEQIEEMI